MMTNANGVVGQYNIFTPSYNSRRVLLEITTEIPIIIVKRQKITQSFTRTKNIRIYKIIYFFVIKINFFTDCVITNQELHYI